MVGHQLSRLERQLEDRSLRRRLEAIKRGKGKTLHTQPTPSSHSSQRRKRSSNQPRNQYSKKGPVYPENRSPKIPPNESEFEYLSVSTESSSSDCAGSEDLESPPADDLQERRRARVLRTRQLTKSTKLQQAPQRVKLLYHSSGRILEKKEISDVLAAQTKRRLPCEPTENNETSESTVVKNDLEKVGKIACSVLRCDVKEISLWVEDQELAANETCLSPFSSANAHNDDEKIGRNHSDSTLEVAYFRNLKRLEEAGCKHENLLMPWFS